MYEEVEREENDMSPIVYVPQGFPKKHECKPPEQGKRYLRDSKMLYPEGTIWKCDDCGTRWELEHEHYGTSVYGDTEGMYSTVEVIWNKIDEGDDWP